MGDWHSAGQTFSVTNQILTWSYCAPTPERLCTLHPWSFQDLTGQSPEQPGLVSGLMLCWVEGWTRDVLRSPPTWLILWFQVLNFNLSAATKVADSTESDLTEASFIPTGCLLESNLITYLSKGACMQRIRLAEGGFSARSRCWGHAALLK